MLIVENLIKVAKADVEAVKVKAEKWDFIYKDKVSEESYMALDKVRCCWNKSSAFH